MCEYTDKVIEKFKLNPNNVLKKKIRGMQGITTYSLIEALIGYDSIIEAAESLGYTDNPVKQCIRQELHTVFPPQGSWESKGGKSKWSNILLASIGYRRCYTCYKIHLIEDFYSNTSKASGLESYCKYCSISKSKLRKHYILERTPCWADIEAIDRFYRYCPKGYHVDHILPLQGKLVSGLHVLSNLQYMLASDNLIKSNSFTIE